MNIAECAGNAFVQEQQATGSRPACPAESKKCQQTPQQALLPCLSPAECVSHNKRETTTGSVGACQLVHVAGCALSLPGAEPEVKPLPHMENPSSLATGRCFEKLRLCAKQTHTHL